MYDEEEEPHDLPNDRPLNDLDQNDDKNQSGYNGFFYGLFDGTLVNGVFGNSYTKPQNQNSHGVKPVHENINDVLPPDNFQSYKPGQYVVGYNPLLGQHVQDVSAFKPKNLLEEINQQFEKHIVDPLVNLIF